MISRDDLLTFSFSWHLHFGELRSISFWVLRLKILSIINSLICIETAYLFLAYMINCSNLAFLSPTYCLLDKSLSFHPFSLKLGINYHQGYCDDVPTKKGPISSHSNPSFVEVLINLPKVLCWQWWIFISNWVWLLFIYSCNEYWLMKCYNPCNVLITRDIAIKNINKSLSSGNLNSGEHT